MEVANDQDQMQTRGLLMGLSSKSFEPVDKTRERPIFPETQRVLTAKMGQVEHIRPGLVQVQDYFPLRRVVASTDFPHVDEGVSIAHKTDGPNSSSFA